MITLTAFGDISFAHQRDRNLKRPYLDTGLLKNYLALRLFMHVILIQKCTLNGYPGRIFKLANENLETTSKTHTTTFLHFGKRYVLILKITCNYCISMLISKTIFLSN